MGQFLDALLGGVGPAILIVPVTGVVIVVVVVHLPYLYRGGVSSSTALPTGGNVDTPRRGYTATKDQLLDRLARIEGQVRGVARMVDEDRYCIDVVTQINAARAALDKVALGLLDGHVRHCLVEGHGGPTDPDVQTKELMGAVGRLLSR